MNNVIQKNLTKNTHNIAVIPIIFKYIITTILNKIINTKYDVQQITIDSLLTFKSISYLK